MPSQRESECSRCLMCSMHCPIGVEQDELGHLNAVFPRDYGIEQGACVLGLTSGALLRSEDRIYRAQRGGEEVSLEEAVGHLASRLREVDPKRVAFLVDINRPLEAMAAAGQVCARVLGGS